MIDVLISQVKKNLFKGLNKLAKSHDLPFDELQYIIKLSTPGLEDTCYHLAHNYAPVEEITFLKALGLSFDVTMMFSIVPGFLAKTMIEQCEELGIEKDKIRAVLIPQSEKEIRICIYNYDEYVKDLNLDVMVGIGV